MINGRPCSRGRKRVGRDGPGHPLLPFVQFTLCPHPAVTISAPADGAIMGSLPTRGTGLRCHPEEGNPMKNPNGASWVDRYVLKNGMCAGGEILRLRLCLREAMSVGTSFGALRHLSALWGRLCGQHVWEERSGADTLVGDGVLDVPAAAPSVSFADSSPGEGARRRAIRESPLRLGWCPRSARDDRCSSDPDTAVFRWIIVSGGTERAIFLPF